MATGICKLPTRSRFSHQRVTPAVSRRRPPHLVLGVRAQVGVREVSRRLGQATARHGDSWLRLPPWHLQWPCCRETGRGAGDTAPAMACLAPGPGLRPGDGGLLCMGRGPAVGPVASLLCSRPRPPGVGAALTTGRLGSRPSSHSAPVTVCGGSLETTRFVGSEEAGLLWHRRPTREVEGSPAPQAAAAARSPGSAACFGGDMRTSTSNLASPPSKR